MDLQYGHVETALATVFSVAPKGMGAFRARLRHLRNIGLPRLARPGSGRHIVYTERQALEMLLALELENHGYSAKNAAFLAQSIVRQSPYGQHRDENCYIVIKDPQSRGYIQAYGEDTLAKVLKSGFELSLVINVSAFVRKLGPALDQALEAGH